MVAALFLISDSMRLFCNEGKISEKNIAKRRQLHAQLVTRTSTQMSEIQIDLNEADWKCYLSVRRPHLVMPPVRKKLELLEK